ncbi:hypothetical protein [Polaribacter sp.]|uniref:hypothetical protein n=1 Tax=Polaribacter sp. TaxID=1920175 RepID=UPI003F4C1B3A
MQLLTDYVFDGTMNLLTIGTDNSNSKSVYGKLKQPCEQGILQLNLENSGILNISLLCASLVS